MAMRTANVKRQTKEPDTTEDKTAQDLTMYKEMLENLKEEEINE